MMSGDCLCEGIVKWIYNKYRMKYWFFFFSIIILSCNNSSTPDSAKVEPVAMSYLKYNILKTYPHDTASFTEGLFLHNDVLYEGTGLEGKTNIYQLDLQSGKVLKHYKEKDASIFGEGISIVGNDLYQLTLDNKVVYVYDAKTLERKRQMVSPLKQGWGMTTDGKQLIAGDGSSKIYFLDPVALKIISSLNVSDNYGYVSNINELELVDGYIYANIWQTNYIVKINATTGKVEAKLDLAGILDKAGIPHDPSKIDVLNGIAYNPANKHFYVTGKYWPAIIEINIQ